MYDPGIAPRTSVSAVSYHRPTQYTREYTVDGEADAKGGVSHKWQFRPLPQPGGRSPSLADPFLGCFACAVATKRSVSRASATESILFLSQDL
eukprot:6664691-Prymnesium_polylepis.1